MSEESRPFSLTVMKYQFGACRQKLLANEDVFSERKAENSCLLGISFPSGQDRYTGNQGCG